MMLKEFKFGNFRSFKEIQALSMEPMSISRPDLDCFNISELKKERILNIMEPVNRTLEKECKFAGFFV